MSVPVIRSLLETALATALPGFPLAYENVPYTTTQGTAYGEVYLLPAEPDNIEIGPAHIQRGIFQVNLFYPLGAGTGTATAKAETIRAAFPFAQTFVSGSVSVLITRTTEIGQARPESDFLMIPVRVRFEARIA